MLWLYKRVVFGKITNSEIKAITDLNKTEIYIFVTLAILTIFFGVYPDPLLSTLDISTDNLIQNYTTNIELYLAQGTN